MARKPRYRDPIAEKNREFLRPISKRLGIGMDQLEDIAYKMFGCSLMAEREWRLYQWLAKNGLRAAAIRQEEFMMTSEDGGMFVIATAAREGRLKAELEHR